MRDPLGDTTLNPNDPTPRTILLFGGSFDPPHLGHTLLAQAALTAAGADWITLIPAARSPFKDTQPTAPEHRLAMLRAALAGAPRCSISTIELDRAKADPDQPSYTVHTVQSLRQALPPHWSLRLLIGMDQARTFHRWTDPAEIEAAAPILVLRRPNEDTTPPPAVELGILRGPLSGRLLDAPLIDASSTEIRTLLATNPDDPRLTELLDPRVLAHIREHNLYRNDRETAR